MTREVDGQQTQSVIYSLLNKTPDASPITASNTSVICTILSLLNLVAGADAPGNAHLNRHNKIQYNTTPVTGEMPAPGSDMAVLLQPAAWLRDGFDGQYGSVYSAWCHAERD